MNVTIELDEKEIEARLHTEHAWLPLTTEEKDACSNMLHTSAHSYLTVLPNHHMQANGEMTGFMFTCGEQTLSSVLPVSKSAIHLTSIYEVENEEGALAFHDGAIKIVNNEQDMQQRLHNFVQTLNDESSTQATFACIPDAAEDTLAVDQLAWTCSPPHKVGVYHSFGRTLNKDSREHKLYIIVSGCLTKACEEFQNLCYDCRDTETCKRVIDSEECHWLRDATHRNHNRIAYDLAATLELTVKRMLDVHDPRDGVYMALPTCFSYMSDVCLDKKTQQVRVVHGGTFLHKTNSAVIMDMFATEGYWLFSGPKDLSGGAEFGTQFAYQAKQPCFPTSTVIFNNRYPAKNKRIAVFVSHDQNSMVASDRPGTYYAFPDEAAFGCFAKLGFNRNDGTVHLMPLLCHEQTIFF